MRPLVAAVLLGVTEAAAAFTIPSFSPVGETPNVRQVVARFSEPMVTFGDPNAAAPFAHDCVKLGQGRWVEPKSWIFDFRNDLPAGVSCEFTARPDLTALSGSKLTGDGDFSFSTGGPTITDSNPYRWGVPEDAAFILTLNSDYDPPSLVKHAYVQVPGVASKIAIELVTGAVREMLLAQEFRYEERPDPERLKRTVIVRPVTNLPPGKQIQLVLAAGVATAGGVARTKAQKWDYEVRPAFKATLECERENAKSACIPLTPLRLQLTSEVSRALAAAVRVTAGGKSWKPKLSEEDINVGSLTFPGPFPEKAELTVTLPESFKDDAGRVPVNRKSFPLKVKTAAYPPLAKFAANFGVIEAAGGPPMLPLTVRHVESEIRARVYAPIPMAADQTKLQHWYERLKGWLFRVPRANLPSLMTWLDTLSNAEREKSIFATKPTAELDTRRLKDSSVGRKDPNAFEVIGLPLPGPGLHMVEIESRILGASLMGNAEAPMYVHAGALVTNMAVHFKHAPETSLVWVTSLDKGVPVDGALVSIWDCPGKQYFKGKTNAKGFVLIEEKIISPEDAPRCEKAHSAYGSGLLVVAEKGDDLSFAHTSWDDGIERWRFNLPYADAEDREIAAHTVFDRTLLRAGETSHMKTVLRRRTGDGFGLMDKAQRPAVLVLQHEGSEQKYSFDLKWDDAGVAESEWKIPADAKLGSYRSYMVKPGKEDGWGNQINTGEIRVEEFRIPLARGTIDGGGKALIAPKSLNYGLSVQYLSGGGAGNQTVRFRARLVESEGVSFNGYDGFTFATAPVKVGVKRRNEGSEKAPIPLHDADLTLDALGAATVTIEKAPARDVPVKVEAELEYKDPSGEVQTVSQTQTLWPAAVVLGIKPDYWVLSSADVRLKVVALSPDGKPVADRTVGVRAFKRQVLSHRKRLVGGFYAYEHNEKLTALGLLCEGKTGPTGEFPCAGAVKASGQVVFEAFTAGGKKEVTAAESVYVGGKEDWFFSQENDDRIDVVPEKRSYEAGETARLQVRMPFRKAIALVTVEREGITDVYVKRMSGKKPVLKIPMKDSHAPNAYVSVLAVRGRVAKPEPGFLADLAKPAFKLGIAKIQVGTKPYALDVKVTTDKTTYQARDEVEAHVVAVAADGKDMGGTVEAAVAVVDEGLLELRPNASWALLSAMTGERADYVRTFTSAMQVIGKRHFGLKALADGGGGGVEVTRSLFDPLVHWQARLDLGKSGKASFKFKLNDALTSFRIVAIAQAGARRFGTGATTIAATKDIMVLPGVPPVARGGDRLTAGFTLRNTTKEPKSLTARLTVRGLTGDLKPQTIKLAAGEAKEIGWQVTVPKDALTLDYEAEVKVEGAVVDKVQVPQKISSAIPVRTVQATLVSLDKPFTLPVKKPANAEEGRGGLLLTFKKTLAGGFGSLQAYMREYPYTCLEQKLSRAVALGSDDDWRQAMASLPAYLDGNGLLKYYPTSDYGSAMLTAYVVVLAAESGRALPDDAQNTMLNGLEGFATGRITPQDASFGADLTLRKIAAIDALSRHKRATAAMLTSFDHDPEQWPTSTLIDWTGLLGRVSEVPKQKGLRDKALNLLQARLTYRGTEMGFSTEAQDRLWWLMVSPDVNAVRLTLLALEQDLWKDDMAKIVKGALARQGRSGHWDLTTANALGVLALNKFAAKYESKTVEGRSVASLGPQQTVVHDWRGKPDGGVLELAWPKSEATLAVKQDGEGKPWLAVESRAATPLKAAVASGFAITREIKPVRQKVAGEWHVGDIARIRIAVEAQADTGFVVVDDPIPAGASILGTGLGRDARSATEGEKATGDAWPVYRENSLTAMRAYYDTIRKGGWSLEYTLRLNNAGTFRLPPTRVEAMYAPDTYGELPNASLTVKGDKA